MRCLDCDGTGQHPAETQCVACEGRGHDQSGIGWPTEPDPEPAQEEG